MTPRRGAALLVLLGAAAVSACNSAQPGARPAPTTSPSASAIATGSQSPPGGVDTATGSQSGPAPGTTTAGTTPAGSPSASRSADAGPAWPRTTRDAPPPALGAVRTVRVAQRSGGGTLAAGLVLPRVGGSAAHPDVLTPCGRRTTLRAADLTVIPPGNSAVLPKAARDVLVVIDPGHGGRQRGTQAPDRTPEKQRNLEISREVQRALDGRVGRVVFTRDRDMEASLAFRVALVDALRADVAISVHLNAEPDVKGGATPGVETYASLAEPTGRRLAGVVYEHQRRYLNTLGGPWARDRDAGAKYRRGRDGRDYYGLLRRAHRPLAISESLFLSEPREAALVARPDVRRGLGRAIADGIVAFTTTREPGSGWVPPYPRGADPGGTASACVDPAR